MDPVARPMMNSAARMYLPNRGSNVPSTPFGSRLYDSNSFVKYDVAHTPTTITGPMTTPLKPGNGCHMAAEYYKASLYGQRVVCGSITAKSRSI